MIRIQNLLFRYPSSDFELALDKAEFSVGTSTAIIGPSGYGKTTLLYLIAGIYTALEGEVWFGDTQLNKANEQQRSAFRLKNIGFVFQDFKLLSYLNVLDNILLPYRVNPAQPINSEAREKAMALAVSMGLETKLKRHPGHLSHGERQRVAICRALLTNPSLILADEPTGNLDPNNRDLIIDLLLSSVRKNGATLIAVTHDREILKGFDRTLDLAKIENSLV